MARQRRRTFGEVQEVVSKVPGRAPRFRVRYIGPDGVRYRPPVFDSYGAADAFLTNVQKEIRLGIWTPAWA